jgi:hypothetical protein
MTPRPPKFNIAEELAKAVQAVKGSEAKPSADVAPAPAAPVTPVTPVPVAPAVPVKPTIAKAAKRATLAIVKPVGSAMVDPTCRQCRGPIDGKEILITIGNQETWLHPECQRFYFAELEEIKRRKEPPPPPPPIDLTPLATAARWRESFSRLSPLHAPPGCRGFFPQDAWRHCCREILVFLDETRSPYWARIAAECGWDDTGLFGVHPVVGIARLDCAGALLVNLRGERVTQVLPILIRFHNGVAAYRVPAHPAAIPIWDFKEPVS